MAQGGDVLSNGGCVELVLAEGVGDGGGIADQGLSSRSRRCAATAPSGTRRVATAVSEDAAPQRKASTDADDAILRFAVTQPNTAARLPGACRPPSSAA